MSEELLGNPTEGLSRLYEHVDLSVPTDVLEASKMAFAFTASGQASIEGIVSEQKESISQ